MNLWKKFITFCKLTLLFIPFIVFYYKTFLEKIMVLLKLWQKTENFKVEGEEKVILENLKLHNDYFMMIFLTFISLLLVYASLFLRGLYRKFTKLNQFVMKNVPILNQSADVQEEKMVKINEKLENLEINYNVITADYNVLREEFNSSKIEFLMKLKEISDKEQPHVSGDYAALPREPSMTNLKDLLRITSEFQLFMASLDSAEDGKIKTFENNQWEESGVTVLMPPIRVQDTVEEPEVDSSKALPPQDISVDEISESNLVIETLGEKPVTGDSSELKISKKVNRKSSKVSNTEKVPKSPSNSDLVAGSTRPRKANNRKIRN
uniref:Uncharacterized protein n=1 Tax=Clastoptera arizonana TaxID=38151 RepID=A0A1B6C327_9HEMI